MIHIAADRPGPQARAPLGLCGGPPFIATGHPGLNNYFLFLIFLDREKILFYGNRKRICGRDDSMTQVWAVQVLSLLLLGLVLRGCPPPESSE